MADIRKDQEREELHRAIWAIADELRGSVDGWDFKSYVLGMMFYRYISENLTNYINEGEIEAGCEDFDYAQLSDEDAEQAREDLVKTKGFFILPSELFCNVKEKAKTDENLNMTLETVFKHIEESAKGSESEDNFSGLFDDIDVNSNKLGATVAKRNAKLVKLIEGVADMGLGNYKENSIDAFGDAYEYLMSMYASNAGKSGGEFFTPQEVSELLTRMALNHPLAQGVSLVCAAAYAVQAEGKKAVLFTLKWCLPIMLLTAFMNPAFSHEGITILLYFPTGNPLTLESILYGLSAGVMIATVMLWFVNFNRVITSDKFIYLFGRIIPAMSLVLSMTLQFIPKFKAQMDAVVDAQRSIGRDISEGSLWHRTKIAITVLSIMVTWALENAIETADSMKSRGYGLKGRTAFSIYRFDDRDKMALLYLGFCGFYLLSGMIVSAFGFRYFPSIRYIDLNAITLSFQFVYLILCLMPAVLNWAEERKWKAIHSEM